MKAMGGLLGAASLLLMLATIGAAMFPDKTPDWTIMIGAAIVCGVLSVVAFRRSP